MANFNLISEAYEVLSSPQLKAVYDKFGSSGLKNGIVGEKKGDGFSGYTYLGNSMEIFEKFFGHPNPFIDNFKVEEYKPDGEPPEAPADIVVKLSCSLFEFYNGSLRTFTYSRDKIQPDGRTVAKADETMTVEVKPGFDTSTEIRFASKGNEAYAAPHSPLVIKFELNEDSFKTNYKRKGINLVYLHTLSLQDALVSKPISLRTLDGRTINLNLD